MDVVNVPKTKGFSDVAHGAFVMASQHGSEPYFGIKAYYVSNNNKQDCFVVLTPNEDQKAPYIRYSQSFDDVSLIDLSIRVRIDFNLEPQKIVVWAGQITPQPGYLCVGKETTLLCLEKPTIGTARPFLNLSTGEIQSWNEDYESYVVKEWYMLDKEKKNSIIFQQT